MIHYKDWYSRTVIAFAVLLSACGGGKPKTQTQVPGSPASTAPVCQAKCTRVARCPGKTGWASSDECTAKCGSQASLFRSDAVAALHDCYEKLSCDASSRLCVQQAVLAIYPDATMASQDPLFVACRKRYEECKTSDGIAFQDIDCPVGLLLVDTAKTSFMACLNDACASVETCFQGITGSAAQ